MNTLAITGEYRNEFGLLDMFEYGLPSIGTLRFAKISTKPFVGNSANRCTSIHRDVVQQKNSRLMTRRRECDSLRPYLFSKGA